MSFAVTKVRAYGVEASEAVFKRYRQYVVLDCTALAADVAVDLSNYGGTFWTAALADPTNGAVATQALAVVKDVVSRCEQLANVECEAIVGAKLRVATASGAGQYSQTISGHLPSIAQFAGDGAMSFQVILVHALADAREPVEYG